MRRLLVLLDTRLLVPGRSGMSSSCGLVRSACMARLYFRLGPT
jgi:hypothetical protein